MDELLNRMQRIAREDFDKAEKAMVAERREGLDQIYAQAKAMMLEAEKISETPIVMGDSSRYPPNGAISLPSPYSGDAGDETE